MIRSIIIDNEHDGRGAVRNLYKKCCSYTKFVLSTGKAILLSRTLKEFASKLLQTKFYQLAFDITTNLSSDASEINVPPMILQPYIENAIIHGIAPKDGLGTIKIHIENHGSESLKCTINDDGIGRVAAAKNKKPSTAKSLGMMVTSERLQQLQTENNIELSANISDLYDGDYATGTKVEILLPIERIN